jgi:hypothetical protein
MKWKGFLKVDTNMARRLWLPLKMLQPDGMVYTTAAG